MEWFRGRHSFHDRATRISPGREPVRPTRHASGRRRLLPISTEEWDRQAVVQAYDLTVGDGCLDDPEFPGFLRECLRKVSAHAEGIAWLTFEGAFGFDHLFTDDIADQIYGYCVTGDEPVVVWDLEIMKSDRWKREIREVRSVMDRDFPA